MLVVLAAAGLAVAVTLEVADRREDGFCRALPGTEEHPSWWPLGERCVIHRPDGAVATREPTWALTGFVAVVIGAVALGVPAPARSLRRRTAEALLVPLFPLAAIVTLVVTPRSLSRLVAIATISLWLTILPAGLTAVAVRRMLLTSWRTAIPVSWLGWAAAVFYAGRGGVAP